MPNLGRSDVSIAGPQFLRRTLIWAALSLSEPLQVLSKCYVLEHKLVKHGFTYQAGFPPGGLPASCNPQQINMTRLYMKGACIGTRDNDFSSPPDCTKKNGTVAATSASCAAVFAAAPKGAVINLYDFARGELYEKGKVCSSELTGYFFMQTDCKDTKNVGFLFSTGKYDGGICQNGRALSSGAIVGIAVACVVVIFGIAAAIFLFLRKRKMDKLAASVADTAKQQTQMTGGNVTSSPPYAL